MSQGVDAKHGDDCAKYSTPKQRVEHGLDSIPLGRTVEVSLRDLMYVHQTLTELVQFCHQPMHYPDLGAVQRFLGSRDSGGAMDVLFASFYTRMRDMIPPDIEHEMGHSHRFEHPLPPNYFDPGDEVSD